MGGVYKCNGCDKVFMTDGYDSRCPYCNNGWTRETDDFRTMECSGCHKSFLTDGYSTDCPYCGNGYSRESYDSKTNKCSNCGTIYQSDRWNSDGCPRCGGHSVTLIRLGTKRCEICNKEFASDSYDNICPKCAEIEERNEEEEDVGASQQSNYEEDEYLDYEEDYDEEYLPPVYAPTPAPRAKTEPERVYVYDATGKEIGMMRNDGNFYDGRLDKDEYVCIGSLSGGMYFVNDNIPSGYMNENGYIYEMDDIEMKDGRIESFRPFLAGYMILKKIFNTRGEYLGYVQGKRPSYDNFKIMGGAALLLLGDKGYIIRTVDKDKDYDDLMKIKREVIVREYAILWKKQGLCTSCGGKVGGIFSKKCRSCGTKQ